jgi:hypothetical protein
MSKKNGTKTMLFAAICWCSPLLSIISVDQAVAQDCAAIFQQIIHGQPGFGSPERAAALSDFYNRNCRNARPVDVPAPFRPERIPEPQIVYPQPPDSSIYQAPPPQIDIYNNPLTREAERLGSLLMQGQPLRQNIPLSSGTVMMQNVPAPPPAPVDYKDPFAPPPNIPNPSPRAPIGSPRGGGSLTDIGTLQPPPAPGTDNPAPQWTNPDFTRRTNCTFNSPACR